MDWGPFQGKSQIVWSCRELWHANCTLYSILNWSKGAGLSHSCYSQLLAEGCLPASGSWGPKADKLPGRSCFEYPSSPWAGLQSLRCLPLERKKNIDPGEGCAEVIKGIWPEPCHCTYSLSKLFFCFGETLSWGDGGRQFLEGKDWQTFSLK